MGELLSICSVKYYERAPEYHIHKGRICFGGDCARDQNRALAVYQELAANPTRFHTANSNIAYGCLPGNKTTQADAIRTYIQSKLKSVHETWVAIPYDLWPSHWKSVYTKPMCKLERALYGHPESGAHWENHFNDAVISLGGKPVPNHPSSFWFREQKLLLTVYVDDLLLSGPSESHADLWKCLETKIDIEPPEPLTRLLGRSHVEPSIIFG